MWSCLVDMYLLKFVSQVMKSDFFCNLLRIQKKVLVVVTNFR